MSVADHTTPAQEPSSTVEDYVKAIYALETRREGAVTTTALATRLGLTAGSVSAMVKRLNAHGLVEHTRYHGVQLTPSGERIALKVIRKHRLLELFLVETLGVSWDRVDHEAEVLEHHLSDELTALIAAKLCQPTHDPHGDPIPTADGTLHETESVALETLEPGAIGTFIRVSDSEPGMLCYLAERRILPGARFEVLDRQPFGGPLTVRFDNSIELLGGELTRAMRVEPQGRQGTDRPVTPAEEARS